MVPRKPACLVVLLAMSACGDREASTEEPVAAPLSVPEPAQVEDHFVLPSFSEACDGNGPHADLGVTSMVSSGDVQIAMVHCEFYAYQGDYEVWVLPEAHGTPFKTARLTGMGGLSEDGATFTNFNKARGPGDCGTFTRYRIDAQGLHETEVRERACSDTAPNVIDPSTWPLVGQTAPCAERTAFFHCPVAGGKTVSLCGNADGSGLQYRFGPPGAPELVLPDSPDSSGFGAGEESWVRASADFVAVHNDEYRYTLISKAGGGGMGEGEMNNFVGIRVDRSGEEVARIRCEGSSDETTDELGQLIGTLTQIGYF